MELKKIYRRVLDDDGVPVIISTGKLKGKILLEKDDDGHPIVDHVKVLRVADIGSKKNFATQFVLDGLESGFITLSKDKLTFNTVPELQYKIIRKPGHYCCHDNEPCGSSQEAQVHILEHFKGVKSPDPQNPSGYRKDNFYASERIQ